MQEAKEKLLNSYNDLLSDMESSLANAMADRSSRSKRRGIATAWERPAPLRRRKTP